MPNYTDNRVILSHDDSQQIDMIYNIMNTEDTPLCQTLIPMDEKLLEVSGFSDDYKPQGWYEWRLENWGTKWDVGETHCTRIDANTLQLTFYTAWSPPIPIFDKLVDMGFKVNARYLDESWMYAGEYAEGDNWTTNDVESLPETYPELDLEFGISEHMAACEVYKSHKDGTL